MIKLESAYAIDTRLHQSVVTSTIRIVRIVKSNGKIQIVTSLMKLITKIIKKYRSTAEIRYIIKSSTYSYFNDNKEIVCFNN